MQPDIKRPKLSQNEKQVSEIKTEHALHKKLRFMQNMLIRSQKIYTANLMVNAESQRLFVFCPQSQQVRIQTNETPENVLGCYTEAFTLCNIFIVIGKNGDKTRISLAHVDVKFSSAHLASALRWVEEIDKEPRIYIYGRYEDTRKQLAEGSSFVFKTIIEPALGKRNYNRVAVKSSVQAISVDKKGSITEHEDLLSNIMLHPGHIKMELNTKIYEHLLGCAPPVLPAFLYDTSEWTTLADEKLQLHSAAKQQIAEMEVKKEDAYCDISIKFFSLYYRNPRAFGVTAIPENMFPMLSFRAKNAAIALRQYFNLEDDDYEKLFVADLSKIISKVYAKNSNEGKFLGDMKGIIRGENIYQQLCDYLFKMPLSVLDSAQDIVDNILNSIHIRNSLEPYFAFRKKLYDTSVDLVDHALSSTSKTKPGADMQNKSLASTLTLGNVITTASQVSNATQSLGQESETPPRVISNKISSSIQAPALK